MQVILCRSCLVKFLKFITVSISFILSLHYGHAKNIEIITSPEEAEVFIINPSSGERLPIGATPYKGPIDIMKQKASGASAFVIEIAKPGFDSYRMLYSVLGSSDVSIRVNLSVVNNIALVQDLDLLMADLFDVQRMVRTRDFTSALSKIELLEAKFPQYSILHELKGSVFYLTQEYARALAAYRRAFALNSKNADAYRMKIYLERRFGTNEVASN